MDPSANNPTDMEQIQPSISLWALALIFLATIGGAAAAILVLPAWIPGMSTSLTGEQPKVFWYLSRSSAIIAYFLLWASMILGVSVTNKAAVIWPGLPTAIDLHQYFTILGLAFALFHGLILIGDGYLKLSLQQILTPFGITNYRPEFVGIGQIAFYLWILITASFYVRRKITTRVWRAIHLFSYLTFIIALIHGLGAGTDSVFNWSRLIYSTTAGVLFFMTLYRILNARSRQAKKTRIHS